MVVTEPILLGLVAATGGIVSVGVREGIRYALVLSRGKKTDPATITTDKMRLLIYEHSVNCPLPRALSLLTESMASKNDINNLAEMIRRQTERWDAHLTFHLEHNNLHGEK